MATLPVGRGGVLGAAVSVERQVGSGPHRRQSASHAHGVAFAPGGFLLSADLGADRIFAYRFDAATHAITPHDAGTVIVAPGSGPRHLAVAPDGRFLYATFELTAEVAQYRWDRTAGRAALVRTIAATAPDYAGTKSAAELAFSHDGNFLYVSTRGEDDIVVFAVDRADGRLSEIQRVPSGGKTPWHVAFDRTGRWLLVANQGSDRITVFRVEAASGRLSPANDGLSVPKPVNVAFLGG